MEIMHDHQCRHLPVLREDKVAGMVSMRDLMYYDLERKAEEIRHMRQYIQSGVS
jgi:CBS domain-containing protein